MKLHGHPSADASGLTSWGSLLVGLGSAALVITCGGAASSGAVAPTPPQSVPAVASSSPAVVPDGTAPASAPRAPLSRFGAALEELRAAKSQRAVRVLWLGDSHAAADYWPDVVRRSLQERWGDGGPGAVPLVARGYRHSGLSVDVDSNWKLEPAAPSSRVKALDGRFGLGGVRLVPLRAGARLSVTLSHPKGSAPAADKPSLAVSPGAATAEEGMVRWTVVAAAGATGARLDLQAGAEQGTLTLEAPGAGGVASPQVQELTAPRGEPFHLTSRQGDAQVLGVYAEYQTPGVVLDTLGVNGARLATLRAWDEDTFVELLSQRAPSLVLFVYGTNEVYDIDDVSRFGRDLEDVMRRVRRALPEVDCAVLGVPDVGRGGAAASQRAGELADVQRQSAEAQGCAFFDTFDAMGGPDAFETWAAAEPALATKDGVHFASAGYRRLGQLTQQWLWQQLGVAESPQDSKK